MYLLRGLHLDATLPWSVNCDALFQQTWLHICGLPHLSASQWQLVTATPALGGLGLHRMRLEAPLHALSQALAIRALRFAQSQATLPWTMSERRALDLCDDSFNVAAVLQRSQVQMQAEGCIRAMRKLRLAQPLARRCVPCGMCRRDSSSTVLHMLQSLRLTSRSDSRGRQVYCGTPSLKDATSIMMRHWRGDQLELPPFGEGVLCEYTTRSSSRLCCMPVDQRGEHCSRCCHALMQAQQHALRDWVKQQLQEIGDHATLEQNIMVRQGRHPRMICGTVQMWLVSVQLAVAPSMTSRWWLPQWEGMHGLTLIEWRSLSSLHMGPTW